jgi:Ca2+-binding RTX toxin-like protein
MAIVAGASYTATLNDCSNYPGSSWAFTQYATSAFRLSLTTGDGDDWVQCHGNGLTSCYGHDGNDLIFTSNVKAELLGENGDDGLISSVTASTLSLRGASGSDCIEAPSPTPGVYDCGTGADDFSTGALGTGCDMVVASCD